MRFLLLLLIWLPSQLSVAVAQEPPSTGIAHFGLVQLGEGVRIEVTLEAGFTCNGIQLLRSADSMQFETIGLIGGVCGSTTEEVSYDFYDPQPLDGRKHFYSLLLGGRIPSEVLSIKLLDFQKIGFVMWPNPASRQLQLRWQNEAEQLHQVTLLGAQGQPLCNWQWGGSETELQLPPLPAGLYFIHLRNSSTGAQWQQRLLLR